MDDDVKLFGETLGQHILAREWESVHALLAPWLRATMSVDAVREFFEDEYRAALAESGIDELHYPEYPEPDVGGNGHTNATALRQPMSWEGGRVRNVPPEVTDENMKYWMRLQLQCSDDQMERFGIDFLSEVWLAVVGTDEGIRVGYWGQGPY